MKKCYIILGDDNVLYASFTAENQDQIDEQLSYTRGMIEDSDAGKIPNELLVYEVSMVLKSTL